MSTLRELVQSRRAASQAAPKASLYSHFGFSINPFPPAGAPAGHPHLETDAETKIVQALTSFDRDAVSQVLVIEGTQWVGNTNLLTYFKHELQELYSDAKDFTSSATTLIRSRVLMA